MENYELEVLRQLELASIINIAHPLFPDKEEYIERIADYIAQGTEDPEQLAARIRMLMSATLPIMERRKTEVYYRYNSGAGIIKLRTLFRISQIQVYDYIARPLKRPNYWIFQEEQAQINLDALKKPYYILDGYDFRQPLTRRNPHKKK